MLDLRFVRENIELITERMGQRGEAFDPVEFLHWDGERKRFLQKIETLRAERNRVSEQVALLKKERKDPEPEIARMKEVSERIKQLDEEAERCESRLQEILFRIPNLPHASVPPGRGSEENEEIRRWGTPPSFGFDPKPHWEIGSELDIIDFGRAAKIAGARFPLLKGHGALLERALINFMLDLHTREHGYQEIFPPLLVNRSSMTGTGQLPKFEADLFRIIEDDLFLIPTAEVPMTNIHRDEILDARSAAPQVRRVYPLFPPGGRFLRERHPGPHSPASIQQGRAGEIHLRRGILRGAGDVGPGCGDGSAEARNSLSGGFALHGRFRLCCGQDL